MSQSSPGYPPFQGSRRLPSARHLRASPPPNQWRESRPDGPDTAACSIHRTVAIGPRALATLSNSVSKRHNRRHHRRWADVFSRRNIDLEPGGLPFHARSEVLLLISNVGLAQQLRQFIEPREPWARGANAARKLFRRAPRAFRLDDRDRKIRVP